MQHLTTWLKDLSHIFFPHVCAGCGNDVIDSGTEICVHCMHDLSITNFNTYAGNLTEKNFYGRIPIINASSLCYFTRDSLIRHLMHQLKYKGNKDIGFFLGKMMGTSLRRAARFDNIDALIPLPLHTSRQKKRGYNQAALLCNGMAEIMQLPVLENAVKRSSFTDTQTSKTRSERWQNMEGRFELKNPEEIKNRHILLVDDVITTGATLEACGLELLKAEGVQLSISTLAFAVN